MIPNRFQEQTAIVTGGADGLGKAVAERLAKEGAKVALLDLNEELLQKTTEEMRSQGLNVSAFQTDISNEDSVKTAVENVVQQLGSLEIVYNSAGIVGPNNVKTSEVSLEGFEKVYQVNLRGSFLITKYALQHMEKANYGRILLVASIAGKEGNAGMCAYSSSKAGVIGLVKATGKEYAETNITINGLAPAVIRTAMVDNMNPDQVKYMTDKIPMKRCGSLDEVASLSCWILSKESGFNTGFTFDISGGRAVY